MVNFFLFLWALLYFSISLNQLNSFTHLTLIAGYCDHYGRTRVMLSWHLAVTLVAFFAINLPVTSPDAKGGKK